MKKLKKITSIICIFSIMCSVTFYSNANDFTGSCSSNQKRVTPSEYAQLFINAMKPDKEFDVGETIKIYNEDDLLSGFCVDLMFEGNPSGYVVIKFDQNGGPVVSEFATDPNTGNIYDEIAEKYQEETSGEQYNKMKVNEKKIYSFGPNEYMISQKENNNSIYVDNYGKTKNENQFKEEKNTTKIINQENYKNPESMREQQNNIETYSAVSPGAYENEEFNMVNSVSGTISEGYIPRYYNAIKFATEDIVPMTNKYACTIVAVLNAFSYINSRGFNNILLNNSYADTFNSLWDYADCINTEAHTLQANIFGTIYTFTAAGTWPNNVVPAITSYINDNTPYSINVSYLTSSEFNYTSIKNAITSRKPCLYSYWFYLDKDGDGIGDEDEQEAHTVYVCGYAQTINDQYFAILDGWHDYFRYINITGYYLIDECGYIIDTSSLYK